MFCHLVIIMYTYEYYYIDMPLRRESYAHNYFPNVCIAYHIFLGIFLHLSKNSIKIVLKSTINLVLAADEMVLFVAVKMGDLF